MAEIGEIAISLRRPAVDEAFGQQPRRIRLACPEPVRGDPSKR